MSAILELQEKSPVLQTNPEDSNLYRLRVEDYDKMIEHGIFDEDEKIELWDGVLIKMSPKGIKHANAVRRIDKIIKQILGEKVIISSQDPIQLNDFSEPEPDITLIKPPLETYDLRHPIPADIHLLVEIAESSIAKDRGKASNYGRSGIPQYLILNLNTNEIEDYREPSEDGYRSKKTYTKDEKFNLAAFPEVEIKVADLLPPSETDAP